MTSQKSPILSHPKGKLIIIGGHEEKDRTRKREILSRVAQMVGRKKLVIATVASSMSEESFQDYKKVFTDLGVKTLSHLDVNARHEAFNKKGLTALEGAHGIFFTGGDQLKITSGLGGTDLCKMIHEVYSNGGFIAGTSAGASVMSDTMMVSGPSDSTAQPKSVLMAPGLGFVKDFIIDQHFSERGRISRLMAAVATNPKYLGLGIDEDTAVVIEGRNEFKVIGAGAAYVINGERSTHNNISGDEPDTALSAHNIRVDVLCSGESYDIARREPIMKFKGKRILESEFNAQL